jgi:hypothetical protein
MNGSDTLFPHEILKATFKYLAEEKYGDSPAIKDHFRAMWATQVKTIKDSGGLKDCIMMGDFSGSMSQTVVGDTPYWVSMAMCLLGAEMEGQFLGFESNPMWCTFPEGCTDLFDRINYVNSLYVFGQGVSTDFQKAMDLVLTTLKEKRVRPGSEPENLIVLTDMGWDQACSSSEMSDYTGHSYRHIVKTAGWQTHIQMIQEAFKRAGEDMWGPGQGFTAPRIVIWNLAASPKDIHAKADQPGVAMLSGWSPSQFKVLCEAGPKPLTALDILRMELDNPQYDAVREALRGPPESAADFDVARWSSGRL